MFIIGKEVVVHMINQTSNKILTQDSLHETANMQQWQHSRVTEREGFVTHCLT